MFDLTGSTTKCNAEVDRRPPTTACTRLAVHPVPQGTVDLWHRLYTLTFMLLLYYIAVSEESSQFSF